MNKCVIGMAVLLRAACAASAQNIEEVLFTGDADCGISSDKTYTHAVSLGTCDNWGNTFTVKGVEFVHARANHSTTPGVMPNTSYTWRGTPPSPHAGTEHSPLTIKTPPGDEAYKLMFDFFYGEASGELVLEGLEKGRAYEFRLYQRCWQSAFNRTTKLTFRPNAVTAEIHRYNPDVLQSDRYIAYRYVADDNGVFRVGYEQDTASGSGGTPHLYAFTNEEYRDPVGVLNVAGFPANYNAVSPPYGNWFDVGPGSNIAASVVELAWTNTAGNVSSFPVGWETFEWDAAGNQYVSTKKGGTLSFTYIHPQDAGGRIVWLFAISNLFTAAAPGGGGTVSGGGWHAAESAVTLTATPDPGFVFNGWTGDVPAGSRYENPLPLSGAAPRALEAEFILENAAGRIRHVATNGLDSANGLSWANAKLTIANAVADLPSGGLVLVGEGNYPVTAEIYLDREIEVRGATGNRNEVHVFRDPALPNPPDNVADIRVFRLNHASAKVSFMTVRNGRGGTDPHGQFFVGGNILINAGTVADCVVRDGFARYWSGRGGNIALVGPNARVLRCAVLGGTLNWVDSEGGGIYMQNGRVEQCWIQGNSDAYSTGKGAAVGIAGGVMLNCTITRNSSEYQGGAVWATGGQIVNCVIVDNRAPGNLDANGGSVFGNAGQAARFLNCVADTPVNPHCFFTADNMGFLDAPQSNYRPTAASFVRGKGAHVATRVSLTDYDGNPLPLSGPVDAGCWQYPDTGAFDFGLNVAAARRAVPFEAVFHVEAVNASGPAEYVFDFGDGGAAAFTTNVSSFTVSHTYTAPGTYTAGATGTVDQVEFVVRLLPMPMVAAPDVIHVRNNPQDPQAPAFPHDAWTNALTSVLDALPFAADGTLILVSNGTYYANSSLVLDKAFTVRGIAGNPRGVALTRTAGNHTLVVLDHPEARVEGVTIHGADSNQRFGGNVNITARGGTLTNCVIAAGQVSSWGNGDGGGVCMRNGLVTHCVIENNTVNEDQDHRGAGVRMFAGRLEHSLVRNNYMDREKTSAGGVYASGGSVVNCTFVGNSTRTYGGIYATGGARVVNTVLAGNRSTIWQNDHAAWGGDRPCYVNCLTDTAAAINASCTNFPAAVLLANIGGQDYTPAPGSPAIGAAVDASLTVPAYSPPGVDLAGAPLMGANGARDAGCYEFDMGKLAVNFLTDQTVCLAPSGTGAEITFTATVFGTNEFADLKYYWDFGDEKGILETALPEIPYTFLTGGWFTVTLTVTNHADNASAFVRKPDLLRLVPPKLYVDLASQSAKTRGPFDTWDNASRDIQAAIEFAIEGCTVFIREGTYTINTDQPTYWACVRIQKPVRVQSEFDDPSTVRIRPGSGHTSNVLYLNHPGAWASGLTLQEGRGDGNANAEGKGVRIESQGGTVSNCVIRACHVQAWGGVANLASSNALLTHCVITGNRVYNNDYVVVQVDDGRFENCLVYGNWFQKDGKQVGEEGNSAIVQMRNGMARNCTLAANAGFQYGVFWFRNNPPSAGVEYCVAAGNGEIPLMRDRNLVRDCTVDVWHAAQLAGFNNTTCRLGEPEKIFKDFQPFGSPVPGNFRLASSSPALNAGPRLAEINFPVPSVDLDNRPRILGGKIDHGCYEGNPPGTLLLVR